MTLVVRLGREIVEEGGVVGRGGGLRVRVRVAAAIGQSLEFSPVYARLLGWREQQMWTQTRQPLPSKELAPTPKPHTSHGYPGPGLGI